MSEQKGDQQRPTFDEPYKPEDYPRPIAGEGILVPARTFTQYQVRTHLTEEQIGAMDRRASAHKERRIRQLAGEGLSMRAIRLRTGYGMSLIQRVLKPDVQVAA